ncbi:subtilase family protein [Mycobacterium xenopi 4042]|uniref:Subtilase family protein n=1 Tax=Mycobacterium xenopi 4042 TaxID=1299334 RepID=X8CMQ4_MYCXE|nr:subtilase family protein [Mycobacterium xenopi 4042]
MDRRTFHLGAHAMNPTASRTWTQRTAAMVLTGLLVGLSANVPAAQAIPPPSVDPGRVPADGKPGPDQPMRQSNVCARTITVAEPNVAVTAPGFTMLNIGKAWQYSTGNGVPVAVIDTGVNPSPRLPAVAGGDYIMGGDGLMDCDAHGTIVASVIAAAPQGIPMPARCRLFRRFRRRPVHHRRSRHHHLRGRTPAGGATAAAVAGDDHRNQTGTTTTAATAGRRAVKRPGDPTPDQAEDPEVPPPPPGAPDGVVGVAPHATIIAIRQSSRAYEPVNPGGGDIEARKKAGTVATLGSAIVHAANMGAKVINVSVTSCVSAADPLDQSGIGAAVWYAATAKDAVIVAAAGNEGEDECAQNPSFDPLDPSDPRDWHQVKTVSSPSWFSDYVLSVGAVDNTGAPISKSLSGPWVAAAAPGVGIMGLSRKPGTGERLPADTPG